MSIEMGSKVQGKVTGITNFGAFVELPGGTTGLVQRAARYGGGYGTGRTHRGTGGQHSGGDAAAHHDL